VIDALDKLGGGAAYTHCVMLLPTFPLRTACSIDEALALSIERGANVVSVRPLPLTVTHLRTVTPDGTLRPLHDVRVRNAAASATSGGPALFVVDGSIQVAPVRPLLWSRTFHYGSPLAFELCPVEAMDINTEDDLRLADLHVRHGAEPAVA